MYSTEDSNGRLATVTEAMPSAAGDPVNLNSRLVAPSMEIRGTLPDFVIPKNKLSGALVPVTRPSKWEPIEPKIELTKPKSRKTRWGPDLTEDLDVKRRRALALQTRAEQLAAQLESGNLGIDYNEATRSPSPPPVYDTFGHRMNTREARKREQLDVERREAVGECMKLNPAYKPPAGFRPVPKEAKLYIPVKEYPGYNFIGLILGPRGNTQKHMEAETGARITIRGKGSVKEGKAPVKHAKENDYYEDLHVLITGDTWDKVDAAIAIIKPLLIPVDEYRNVHIMKQLRELAEINGTVRDITRFCGICGELGHKDWQCPKDKLQTFQAKVTCRLCGDGSHPTFDCPLKNSAGEGKTIDKEYLNFLEELGLGLKSAESSGNSSADTSKSTSDASAEGGPPKFPFPFPPGPAGMQFLSSFLPRFFQGIFNGRPFPGPAGLAMMARMFATFRGRFPFPPLGLRPNMRPPTPMTVPEGSSVLVDAADGQSQNNKVLQPDSQQDPSTSETGVEGILNPSSGTTITASPLSSLPFTSSTIPTVPLMGPQFQTTCMSPYSGSSVIGPPAQVTMLPPAQATMMPSPSTTFSTLAPNPSEVPQPTWTAPHISSTPNPPLPLSSSVPNPPLPVWPSASVTPLPVRPAIPSVRPVMPSFRPVNPIPHSNPSYMPIGPASALPPMHPVMPTPPVPVRPVVPSIRPALPSYMSIGQQAQETPRFSPVMSPRFSHVMPTWDVNNHVPAMASYAPPVQQWAAWDQGQSRYSQVSFTPGRMPSIPHPRGFSSSLPGVEPPRVLDSQGNPPSSQF